MGFARPGWIEIVRPHTFPVSSSRRLIGYASFLKDELSWDQEKVDDLLLPIIQKMNKRSQVSLLRNAPWDVRYITIPDRRMQ